MDHLISKSKKLEPCAFVPFVSFEPKAIAKGTKGIKAQSLNILVFKE